MRDFVFIGDATISLSFKLRPQVEAPQSLTGNQRIIIKLPSVDIQLEFDSEAQRNANFGSILKSLKHSVTLNRTQKDGER